jgi:hypothetical protein
MTVLNHSIILSIAEWDDDMTYLYVDYPYYKKYLMFFTATAVPTLNNEMIYIIVLVPLQLQYVLP